MQIRDIIFGRRSSFPALTEATGFDFLVFPGEIDASMFTKMGLQAVDIRTDEAVSHVFDKPGGIIVFSVNVNVLPDETRFAAQIKNFVAAKWQAVVNRLRRYKKIDRASQQVDPEANEITGLSIGRFFRGRYRAKSGIVFDETSLSVEVIGVSTEMLLAFATALANEFHQETVLVKDYNTRTIYLADQHPTSLADLLKLR